MVRVNRKFKDSLFRMVFHGKEELLKWNVLFFLAYVVCKRPRAVRLQIKEKEYSYCRRGKCKIEKHENRRQWNGDQSNGRCC